MNPTSRRSWRERQNLCLGLGTKAQEAVGGTRIRLVSLGGLGRRRGGEVAIEGGRRTLRWLGRTGR